MSAPPDIHLNKNISADKLARQLRESFRQGFAGECTLIYFNPRYLDWHHSFSAVADKFGFSQASASELSECDREFMHFPTIRSMQANASQKLSTDFSDGIMLSSPTYCGGGITVCAS